MQDERQTSGALRGLTVVDLTRTAAGAITTMLLAEHGARVIRVLDADAPVLRTGGFAVWDRGKEAVRIDLARIAASAATAAPAVGTGPALAGLTDRPARAADSQQLDPAAAFARLVAAADVLVDDFAPGDDSALLVAVETLKRLNTTLVHCSITAYGRHGAWRDEPPVDDLVMARMGILASMPGHRPPPVHVVHPLPSVGAGLLAALGVAAALYDRARSGRGRRVETSLMAGALLYHPKVTAEQLAPRPFQSNPAGSAPFYSVYECADGEWVQLGCVHTRFVATIARVMGIETVVSQPRFGAGTAPGTPEDDAELRQLLAEIVRTRPYAEWAEAFEAADVPFARARRVEESLDDPQVAHNGLLVTLNDPQLGPLAQMGVTLALEATPGGVPGPRLAGAVPLNVLPSDLGEPRPGAAPDAERDPQPLPLSGIRILEITNLIAGPTAGRLLADLGADVIKLEPLTGDLSRPIGRTYFFSVNFNKRSVSVQTGSAEGKRVVAQIAATCDALLANLRPGATQRMGLTRERHPHLIETHLTGYGQSGPYAHRPGIDPLAQALMGLERAQGGDHNPPVFPAQLAPTDFTTGALGALGTVLALLERQRSGVVQTVSANLLGGAAMLSSEWFTRFADRTPRPLADRAHYGLGPFHRLYQLRDGWLYVAADSAADRKSLLASMLSSDMTAAADPAPGGDAAAVHPNEQPLAQQLAAVFAALTVAACSARLERAGVPYAPVLAGDGEVFLHDPHARANHVVVERRHPVLGAMRVATGYVRFGVGAPAHCRPTPLLGEHTRQVLAEAGLAAQAVEALFAQGLVKSELPD